MKWKVVISIVALSAAGCASSTVHGGGSPPPPTYPFTAANTLQFVHEFGTNTYVSSSRQGDATSGLATDSSGNVVIAGYTAGNLPGYFGTVGTLKGTLYERDSDGNQLWAKELTTGQGDNVDGVVATAAGIFIVGDTLGAYPGASNPNGADEAFVAEFDTAGNLQWLKQYPSSVYVTPQALCVDGNGNLIFAGETTDSSGSNQNMFIQKVDASGNEQWQKTYGSNAVDLMTGITADENGDIYAVGSTSGPFPGSQNHSLAQAFVLKLDGGTGATVWLQQFGGNTTPPIFYPATLQAIGGGKLDILGESVVQITNDVASNTQIEVMQMDAATGSPLWNLEFGGGPFNIPGSNLAVDANGDMYVGGLTKGALTSGVTAGTQDIFLAKIGSSGIGVWAQQIGTGSDGPTVEPSNLTPVYVALGDQSVFLGGMTTGQFTGFSNPNHDLELFLAKFGQ